MIDHRAFTDEMVKISVAKEFALKVFEKHPLKFLAAVGTGGVLAAGEGKKAIEDLKLGRAIRQQSQQQR